MSNLALVLAGVLAGCDDASPVHVADVDRDTYLRGPQVSRLEISAGYQVASAELYLDGLRVAVDELAPFELAWDTRSFADGAHQLTGRIYLADGSHRDGATDMWIDNTPPQLGVLATAATRGKTFMIPATDNLKIAQVEVSRGVQDEPPIVVAGNALGFDWPWGCGTTAIHVRVLDAAGGEATSDVSVSTSDLTDLDCDGYQALSAGGNDCDDLNFAVHPGAPEVPEGFDANCDGSVASLPGLDSDGDGVLSISDGGSDCNDTDSTIHGPRYELGETFIIDGGAPVTWSPGEAVIAGSGKDWQLYLNRDGIVAQFKTGLDGSIVRTPLASGANPGSIAEYAGYVAFGSGNQIIVLQSNGSSWSQRTTIPAAGTVGKIRFVIAGDGDFAAFQVGTQLWFASASPAGSRWNVERVADVGEPISEIMNVARYQGYASMEVHTSHSTLMYYRSTPGDAFVRAETATDGISVYVPLGHQPPYSIATIVARADGASSLLYNNILPSPLYRTTGHVASMAALGDGALLLQYTGSFNFAQVVRINRSGTQVTLLQNVQHLAPFDTSNMTVFAGQGVVLYVSSSVPAVDDPQGDGIDRDCEGLD